MTATNHALTGTAIGLLIGQPWLAIPAAVASHFVCDALPHYGSRLSHEVLFKSKGFRRYLILEALVCASIVAALLLLRPTNWLIAAVCAFAAAAPDLLSINRYATVRRGKKFRAGLYSRFAHGIQWFERPIGAVVEVVWLAAMIVIIAPFL